MTISSRKHTARPLFVAVLILIVSVFLARHTGTPDLIPPAYAQCTGSHDIKTIDTGTSTTSSSYAIDMEIGSDSLPFITYFKSSVLRSAKCSSGTCASSTYATPGSGQAGGGSAVSGYGLSTFLNGNNPFINYYTNASGNEEKFVTCNNSSCTSTSTTSDGADNRNHTAAFRTSDGTPYILNGVATSGQISARRCSNVDCNPSNFLQFGTFLNGATQASRPIPLLPSGGNPIAVYERSDSLTVYACSDDSCSNGSQNIVDIGGVGSYITAVLKNGLPLIAYVQNGSVRLMFCGNWACNSVNTIRTIDSGATGQVSVAVGSDGVPVLSYFKSGGSADLYFARCNNSTCSGTPTITRINTGGVSNQDTVIGLRSGNIPGILFRDGSANLKYVACIDQTCTPDTSGCATPTPTYGPSSKPTNVQVREDDANQGSIIQTYNVYLSWTAPAFAGFASGPNRYHVYISDSPTFTSNVVDVIRAKTVPWYSTRGDAAAIAKVKQNKQYYVRICADYDDGAGGWSQQCAADITYTKIAYSPVTFSGASNQRIISVSAPASCAGGVPNRFMGTLSMTPNTNGYSSSCSTTSAGSKITDFNCTITYDNVNYDPDPQQQFSLTMSGGSAIYGCGGNCDTPGSCTNVFSPNVDANQTKTTSGSQPLYVNTDLAASFFKVKNMSVYTSAGINSPFPAGHQPFDSNDTGDDYFDQGSSGTNTGVGVVMSNGTQTAGLSSAPNNGISARGWRSSNYTSNTTKYIGNGFVAYAKGQKQVQTINSLSDSAFTGASSGIFLISGDLTINNSNKATLNNKYVILMSEGTIRISNDLSPTGGNVALFAQTLYIDDAVSAVKAIMSANAIYITSTNTSVSTTPLSIIGSLSAKAPIDMTKRARNDNDLQPSVFIQADPGVYLNLLPNMSSTKTEYELLQ